MAGLTRLLIGMAVVALGCGQIGGPPPGIERGGWVWPTPAPLPDGATAVKLDVEPMPAVVAPGVEYAACPTALLVPITIHHVPEDVAAPIHYRPVGGGEEVHVRWQFGVSARLAPDLQIVAPDGKVIASEGRPVEGLGGGGLGNDDTFTVCIGDYVPRRVGS